MLTLALLIACGGESKPEAKPPAAPPPAVVTPKPPPAPPPTPTGAYVPDEFAAKAYAAATAAGADGPNPKSGDAAAIAAGKAVYDAKCVSCHGAQGHGDGIAGSALPQKPSNFHHKERWEANSAGVKFWVLKNGIQGTAMAPLGLSDDDAWQVLAYIESEFVGK